MIDGLQLAQILEKRDIKIKSKTKTSLTLMIKGDRLKAMKEITESLSHLDAKIDPTMKGSSIGGIKVGNVKVLIKSEGRTGGLDVELKAINDLSEALMNAMIANGGPINIKMGNRKVSGCAAVKKTDGTPKSDFHIADVNGKPLIHISHKKGSKPNDFQQWGGITEKRIYDHPEVQEFGKLCRAMYGDKIPNGESAYIKIKDKDLKMMSVFGVNFDKGGIDANKVDVLIQGDPGLKKMANHYVLTGTGHVHYHGEIPDGGFDPVLAVIYKGDRDQLGIAGARFSIYPVGGRKFKTQL